MTADRNDSDVQWLRRYERRCLVCGNKLTGAKQRIVCAKPCAKIRQAAQKREWGLHTRAEKHR